MSDFPDVLFRYGKRNHLDCFLSAGRIRLQPASHYKDLALAYAQQDNELTRTAFCTPKNQQARFDSQIISGVVKIEIGQHLVDQNGDFYDYYPFCTSRMHERSLYADFNADSCVRIHNPEEFVKRFGRACGREFGVGNVWAFHAAITYFEPRRPPIVTRNLELAFLKDSAKYFKQSEYRLAVFLRPSVKLEKVRFIEIGSLLDIAEYVPN